MMLFRIFLIVLCFVDNVFSCIIQTKDELEQNYCKNMICPNYGKCKIDENRLYSLSHTKCVCSAECNENDIESALVENLKNRKLRIQGAVCGTDGKDYANACKLRYESCLSNKEIRVIYLGKCGRFEFLNLLKYEVKIQLTYSQQRSVSGVYMRLSSNLPFKSISYACLPL